jgi:quinoprotein glucose dehydrogenase
MIIGLVGMGDPMDLLGAFDRSTSLMLLIFAAAVLAQHAGEWPQYGQSEAGTRFCALSQIDKKNVSKLKRAWVFRTGDLSDGKGKPYGAFECTPVMVDGTLYLSTPFSKVIALDPDSGQEKWRYDPKVDILKPVARESLVNRGVSTWLDPVSHKRRIFIATYDARLIALDARTGWPVQKFGSGGTIDLTGGLGAIPKWQYTVTSPPAVVNGRVIVGSSITDNQEVDAPSGIVRCFSARSGKLLWTWDPLGRRGAVRLDATKPTLPGAGNAWAPISADSKRNLLFVPTGSQSPDFYGGTRPGKDAYADSVTCLHADTGKLVWSFQTVHHNLWDYDVPAQPLLVDIKKNGVSTPAVVAMTKTGHVFVLDRRTGKPLLPVEERAVPASDADGEVASPTQPFPVLPKPLGPEKMTPDEAWGVDAKRKAFVRNKLLGLRNEGVFTPPSVKGTLVYPGDLGGANWSGGSFDPLTNTLFVNSNRLATIVYLVPKDSLAAERKKYPLHEISDQTGAPYGIRREWLFGPNLIPGTPPPWGTLTAIDLASGARRWQVPLGVTPQVAEMPGSETWGSVNLGGSFVTATGLVFIAAATDNKIRAFDEGTGKVLWEAVLPAGGQAAPMSYRSPKSGRQYVVQCAGGHHGLGTTEGDYVIGYCLGGVMSGPHSRG